MYRFYLLFFALLIIGCNNSSPANKAPTAIIADINNTLYVGTSIELDASQSFDSDGEITSYLWMEANATIEDENSATLQWVVPSASGEYPITLTITDDDGATASDTIMIKAIDVANSKPIAEIVASSTTVLVGEDVTLDARSSYDNDGTIVSFLWNDADNQSAADENVTTWSAPNAPGTYSISLTVTDDDGEIDIDTIMIVVVEEGSSPFSAIQNIIASGSATYICVGDSTRANTIPYDGGHVFDALNSSLGNYNVTTHLHARVGHEARDFNLQLASPTWSEVVADIAGNGSTTIVDITLGINDLFNYDVLPSGGSVESIKQDIGEAIDKILGSKPNTYILLTMPNAKDPSASGAGEQNAILRTVYLELSSERNLPLVNVMDEITFTSSMFLDDVIHFHLTPSAQTQVANLILSKILP